MFTVFFQNKGKIVTGTYLPFGMGPRQCIGMQIAKIEAKVLMFEILRNFSLEPCEKTQIPMVLDDDHFGKIKGGCHIKFVPRN